MRCHKTVHRMKLSSRIRRFTLRFLLSASLPFCLTAIQAAEISLSSLDDGDDAETKKSGSFVGVYAGQSTGQNTTAEFFDATRALTYDIESSENNFLMGIEIGYSWKTRHLFELALSFEGMFSSAELRALLNNDSPGVLKVDDDIATAKTDMNYVAFLLNAQVTLDLARLKPRIGPLARFRPYVGAGIGGSQLWFRNQEVVTIGNVLGDDASRANIDPFSLDQFVLAYQFNAGLEIRIRDNLDFFVEYRTMTLQTVDEIDGFESNMVLGGIHLRY